MKLPYGISNFKRIRIGDFLYVDKTRFIEKLESLSSEYHFFIRPGRFGKSLFLSMLESYYDVNEQEQFRQLFSDLYIGKNPTELKNSYLVLKFNFSGLNTDNKDSLERSFKITVLQSIQFFMYKYRHLFQEPFLYNEFMEPLPDVKSILGSFIDIVKKTNQKVYLIIDEYDHFANDLIAMGDRAFYRDVVHASGFVRDFYESIKIGTESVIERIFMTGISPIMLDDLTSGFNMSTNLK